MTTTTGVIGVTDKEQRIIEHVVMAFTIISVDSARAGDQETTDQLIKIMAKWSESYSQEFRALLASTARELGALVGEGKSSKPEQS